MSKAIEENKQKIKIKNLMTTCMRVHRVYYWKFMCTDKKNDKAK